jgi:hypothetical protein
MLSRRALLIAVTALLAGSCAVHAGMPAPLPENAEYVLRLNDSVAHRLQAISFFLLVILGSAAVVRLLWNFLQRDFPRLPRLTYGKSVVGVLLWGLLFVIVLTMISGARELMTPGAWQKSGFTYKLTPGAAEPAADPKVKRKEHLERLRTALWHFAATHDGRFPDTGEMSEIPADLWSVPDTGGLRYLYVPGRSVRGSVALLAYEPELDENRNVLRTNGDLGTLTSTEIAGLVK